MISFEIEESETYKTETVTFSESLTAKQIRNDLQDIITPTMGLLDEILSSAFLNYHKARAQYGKAEIYEEIVKGLKVIAEKYEPVPEAKKPEEAEPGWVITEKIPGEVLPLGFISKIEPLSWPIRGEYVVSSCFGYRGDIGIKGASVCHPGIDILASAGTDVLAAADGEIIQGGVEKDYILIVHDKGLATRYVHVSGRVEKGKKVKRGDIIANVKGDHLHFEVIDYQAGPRHFKGKGITEEEICYTSSEEKLKAKVVFAEPGRRAFKLWNANIINMVVSSDTVLSRTAHLNPLCFFRGEIYEEIKFTETKGIACEEETGGWLKGCELIGSI